MNRKTTIAIGFMLFALFFGAGNLIFPAQLGQYAGTNFWFAALGFLITGVGLPLLGILAMAISGSKDLQELASRIHPGYAIFFTTLLYLTIGPFFASPRTGTVAYEIGIAPFISESYQSTGLLIFTAIFFIAVLLFSLYPAKLVDNIGKILAPVLVFFLGVLLVTAIVKPLGIKDIPMPGYETSAGSIIGGFLEGYNTMDALASLVFGIIIIQAVRSFGIKANKEVFRYTLTSGIIAIVLLGVIYIGIMYLGATSVQTIGVFDNGGPILHGAADHYYGFIGGILLAIVIILACLTTAIGLTIATAEYFHTLFPKLHIKAWVVIFAAITFIVANFGLANIIKFSIPILMFLYPLAIVLILLAFASPLFKDRRAVYVSAIAVTFVIGVTDGLRALCESLEIDYFGWLQTVVDAFDRFLPLYDKGLGWLLPALVAGIIATLFSNGFSKGEKQPTSKANQ